MTTEIKTLIHKSNMSILRLALPEHTRSSRDRLLAE